MKTYIDPETNGYWQFEDSDDIRVIDGKFHLFDALGNRVESVPQTLVPGVLPDPVAPPLAYPRLTALQMLDLFTEAEQLAVVEATMSVPAVKLWYDRMIAATFVTYEDPRTEGGLQALVDAELITAQRKADIVAAMQPA